MSSPGPTHDQGTLARGATIGRFVVLGLVGRGGMGEVYAAYDPELDRKVAVKLLRVKPGAGVSQAEGRARTLREAQAIARLSHPNVVVVYDVGTFQDKVFIAMEFVEGNTVTYWVESQARSWQDVLKVFMSAGRGLAAAHEKGLVHRDFKPDNVMVGKDQQVRVMDFGLARAAPERSARVRGAASDSGERAPGASGSSRGGGADDGGRRTPNLRQGEDTPRLDDARFDGALPDKVRDTPPFDGDANTPPSDDPAFASAQDDSGSRGRSDASSRLRDSSARIPGDPAARVRGDSSQRRGTPRYLNTTDTPTGTPPRPGASSGDAVPRVVDPNSTMVLNMTPGTPAEEGGNLVAFDVPLTRTGAMMGTPAYMAPEQFLGTPTDARTDQFAFCIALYEALYGERPFPGNTMYTLTTNVVQGNVRAAPANSKVPAWVRKILLRGLRPHADERWPSIEDLLEALGKNPSVARKKWLQVAAVPVVLFALGFWFQQTRADTKAVCGGGPAKLAGIWELRKPEEGESDRQSQIHKAFLNTGKGYAADVFATVSRALTTYARAWASMHKENCEATQLRKEQSADVMDLRMTCLDERLGEVRALTNVFTEPSGDVVENAVSAVNALGSLDRCADVLLLRAVVRPPDDAPTRARVADLRDKLSDVKARLDAGRFREAMERAPALVTEAERLKYQPLTAEALALLGFVSAKFDDAAGAERAYVDGFYAAEASRHDEIRASIAVVLTYVVGYQEGHYAEAKRWGRIADSVLNRLGGHELLRAWLLNDLGAVYYAQGDQETAISLMEQSVHLKAKVLGPDHPDVGTSEGNLAIALAELGKYQQALTHVQRSVELLEHGLGAAHPDTAFQFSNRGEILNALGRPVEARASFERARSVWERELDHDSRNLAYALTGIGRSYLQEANPGNALVPLERAFKIRTAQETDPSKRAETAFALACALWETSRDRGRALRLAEAARADYERAKSAPKVTAIEAWLRTRGAG
jgi:serine/threonine protein kinase/tetratricopeptide (TPR) repeat protein